MGEIEIRRSDGGVIVKVKVVPCSSRTAIAGVFDGMLKVKVAAPAEKGKANAALTELLAKKLGVKKNGVRIISGRTSPVKEILIEGIEAEQITKLVK